MKWAIPLLVALLAALVVIGGAVYCADDADASQTQTDYVYLGETYNHSFIFNDTFDPDLVMKNIRATATVTSTSSYSMTISASAEKELNNGLVTGNMITTVEVEGTPSVAGSLWVTVVTTYEDITSQTITLAMNYINVEISDVTSIYTVDWTVYVGQANSYSGPVAYRNISGGGAFISVESITNADALGMSFSAYYGPYTPTYEYFKIGCSNSTPTSVGEATVTAIALYDPGGGQDIPVTLTLNIEVLEPISYALDFDANGGSGAPDPMTAQTYDDEYTFTLPSTTPTRSTYSFESWMYVVAGTAYSVQPGGTVTLTSQNPSATLVAQWVEEISLDQSRILIPMWSDSPTLTAVTAHAPVTWTIANPSIASIVVDGLTVTIHATYPGSTTITATTPGGSVATCTVVVQTYYSLIYDANGGSGAPPSSDYGPTTAVGFTLHITDVEPTPALGYDFLGWAVVPSAASPEYAPGDAVWVSFSGNSNEVRLFAIYRSNWIDVTITLEFDANGGSGAPDPMSYTGSIIQGEMLSASFTLPSGPTHADTTHGAYITTWAFKAWEIWGPWGEDEDYIGSFKAGSTVTLSAPSDTTFSAVTVWTTVTTYYPGWSWSANGSTVFLDTYGVVLIDPTIDIQAYFPDDEVQRLNFYSFAIYGDSFTVNGTTFQVINGIVQDVPVRITQGMDTNAIEYRDLTLQNVAISWSDNGHCYLTFINESGDRTDEYPAGATADLGETVTREDGTLDKTVAFSGVWYMTCAYYRGTTATETVYSWDAGQWSLTSHEFMAIWLAALLTIGVVAHHYRGFKPLDFVVLGVALLIGWAIIGYIF